MQRWMCGGCSSIETGKPSGHVHVGQYEGPQCDQCWEVECEEQAEADRLEEEGIRLDDSRNPRLGIHRIV